MASAVDLAAGSAGAACVLALALAVIALLAWRATRSTKSAVLAGAFVISAFQAGLTAVLLLQQADVPPGWLAVPMSHLLTLGLMYAALLRV